MALRSGWNDRIEGLHKAKIRRRLRGDTRRPHEEGM
jgi:hypothetical protein